MTGVHLFLSLVDQRLLTYRILIEYLLCFTVNQLYAYIYIYVVTIAILEIFDCVIDYRGLEFKIKCIFLY